MSQPSATTAPLPRRPVLKPGLRRLWRDRTTLQIGIGHRHAVVVQEAGPHASAFLDRLDGTVSSEDLDAIATEVGLDPGVARDLLHRLAGHGALDDAAAATTSLRALGTAERDRLAPDLASWALHSGGVGSAATTHQRRRAARVDVHGAGRVGALAAALLTHAGIGELHVLDADPLRAGDVPAAWARTVPTDAEGRPTRADLALDVCEQLAPSVRTNRSSAGSRRSGGADRPTIALLTPVDTLGTIDLDLRDDLVRDQVPHLPAYVRETVGVIGPLVVPGRTPCLRCLDLARTDRDPAWPHLLAQLSPAPGAAPARRRRKQVDACDGVLATLVAAQAALQVLTHVDGAAARARSTSLAINLTDGLTRCRTWAAHPACGCTWT